MKPVAKKATAAELRNKARMSMPCVCEDYCRCDVTTVVDDDALDEILAAARAEAVADVWRAIGLNPDAFGSGTRPVAEAVAIALEDARAEAVTPVLAVLRQLVAACRKCANCESPAMRKAANEALYCDAHGYYLSGTQMDDHRIAAPLRAALALLAADQAGEKAGKP